MASSRSETPTGVSASVPLSRERAVRVTGSGVLASSSETLGGSSVSLEPHAETAEKFRLVEKWKALQDWMEKMAPIVMPQLDNADDPAPVVPPHDAATGLLPPVRARTPGEALQQEQDDDLYAFLEEIDNANASARNQQRTGVGSGTDGMSLSEKLKDELTRYRARPAQSVSLIPRQRNTGTHWSGGGTTAQTFLS